MNNNLFFCRIIDLPTKVRAITVPNDDGTFDVYVNGNLSLDEQNKSFLHEVEHIRKNHFYIDLPVSICENDANLFSKQEFQKIFGK